MASYYDTVVLADTPIRFYNNTDGIDAGSQGRNATLNGGITSQAPGLLLTEEITGCLSLNGSTGFISAPTTGLPTGASAWTFEAWWLPQQTGGTFQGIFSLGTEAAGTVATLYIRQSGHLNWELWDGSTATNAADNSVAYGSLTYIVVRYDGTTLALFLNGASTPLISATTTLALAYGGWIIGCDTGTFFSAGRLAKVALYSAALSTARQLAHYQAGLAHLVTGTNVGGKAGVLVGQFFQGSIGG